MPYSVPSSENMWNYFDTKNLVSNKHMDFLRLKLPKVCIISEILYNLYIERNNVPRNQNNVKYLHILEDVEKNSFEVEKILEGIKNSTLIILEVAHNLVLGLYH